MQTIRKLSAVLLIVAAFMAGVFFTTAGVNFFGEGESAVPSSFATTEATTYEDPTYEIEPPAGIVSFEDAFVKIADTINPMVVQIRAESVAEEQAESNNPLDQFFRNPNPGPRQGLGSGVIARDNGFIITNNHVIEGADNLEVELFDGRVLEAEVVGTDRDSDLAVIKVDESNLPYIRFGDATNVRVGQWVLAFGSPLAQELGNTVTAGIVSALGRNSEGLRQFNLFTSFIQTDASINPGNSGGPLVNLRGNLIGINSMIYSRSGGSQGIGFSIPVDVVENVVSQIIETGGVERGFLGVQYDAISPALAEALDLPRGAAQVSVVTPGTPAEDAGLEVTDIILTVDGVELRDHTQLPVLIGNKRPGDETVIGIFRQSNERRMEVTVVLGDRDELIAATMPEGDGNTPNNDTDEMDMESLGLELIEPTPAVLQRFDLEGVRVDGLLITSVDPNSDAARNADLQRGDSIFQVDGQDVATVADFRTVYRDIDPGDRFLIRVQRRLATPDGIQTRTILTALTKPE